MLKQSIFLLSTVSLLSASTVMCYKKNHFDPETIENTPLKGKICDKKLSVNDMKKNGYEVKDIKIQNGTEGLNYIYIFKKETQKKQLAQTAPISQTTLKAQLKQLKADEEKAKKVDQDKIDLSEGEKIYNKTCKSCHGDGTISAYNSATPLVQLSVEDIEVAFRDYGLDQKDNGLAMIMKPIAVTTTEEETKQVAKYIQTLKK